MKKSIALAVLALCVVALPAFAAQEGSGGPLSPEPGLIIWTLIVFGLLVALLAKFAWPQVLGAVEARERRLEEQIAEAERNRAEAARLLEEQRKLLADSRTAAAAMVAEARAAADRERALALEKTKEEQEELLARARREIQLEREQAVEQLRREAVDLSLAAAAKLIGERLGTEADRRLIESYLSTVEAGR
jgi:F-type H+-transporting ATPase subunit b